MQSESRTAPGGGRGYNGRVSKVANTPEKTAARDYEHPPEDSQESVLALFGDTARAGPWLPPDRLNAIAGFGNVKLDFRQADLPPGPTDVIAYAVFGNVELTVDPELDVEVNGVSVFGSIKHTTERRKGKKLLKRVLGQPEPPPPPPPEDDEDESWIVLKAFAVFGNVKVKVVEP